MNRLLSEMRLKERQKEQQLNEQLYVIHREKASQLFTTIAATEGQQVFDWDFNNFYSKLDSTDPNVPVIAVDVKKYFKNRNMSLENLRESAYKLGHQLLKSDIQHFLTNRTTNDVAGEADCEAYLRSIPRRGDDSLLNNLEVRPGHDVYTGRNLIKKRT